MKPLFKSTRSELLTDDAGDYFIRTTRGTNQVNMRSVRRSGIMGEPRVLTGPDEDDDAVLHVAALVAFEIPVIPNAECDRKSVDVEAAVAGALAVTEISEGKGLIPMSFRIEGEDGGVSIFGAKPIAHVGGTAPTSEEPIVDEPTTGTLEVAADAAPEAESRESDREIAFRRLEQLSDAGLQSLILMAQTVLTQRKATEAGVEGPLDQGGSQN